MLKKTNIIFITNSQLYKKVIEPVATAKSFVWIGTADIKDLHVNYRGSFQSFLSVLNDLARKRVVIRLLYAKEPIPNFRSSFNKYPLLQKNIERQLCPRVHFKHIVIDDHFAYMGSANLTGAGVREKGKNTRNFELGIITTNKQFIKLVMEQFDEVWMGSYCGPCGRKQYCKYPISE